MNDLLSAEDSSSISAHGIDRSGTYCVNSILGISSATWLTLLVCFIASIVLGVLSDGCYHDDDLTHYLMARWVHWHPEYLLHIWGRPGLTIPLAMVAWVGDRFLGWHAARVLSAIVTAAGAMVAAKLGGRLGIRRTWLVVLACYLQPLNLVLSYTTLTENWTALYLIAAASLLHSRRLVAASSLFSLALVTRHEAVVFIPLWWLALLDQEGSLRRKLAGAVVTMWAPLLHNVLFRLVFETWPMAMYLHPSGSTEYAPSGVLSYLPHTLYAITPLLFSLAILGGRGFLRRRQWIFVAVPCLFFLTHAAIKTLGIFASGGYGRFMVAISPFVAILVGHGLELIREDALKRRFWLVAASVFSLGWLAVEQEWHGFISGYSDRRLMLLARVALFLMVVGCFACCRICRARLPSGAAKAMAVALVLTLGLQFILVVRPLRLHHEQRLCIDVAKWIRSEGLSKKPLFIIHPWLVYELGLVEHPRAHKGPALLASMPVGTVVIWDSRYSRSDFHGLDRKSFNELTGFSLIRGFRGGGMDDDLEFMIYEKTSPACDVIEEKMTYPPDLVAHRKPWRGTYCTFEEQP